MTAVSEHTAPNGAVCALGRQDFAADAPSLLRKPPLTFADASNPAPARRGTARGRPAHP